MFIGKETMWGFKRNVKEILVPGIGYGENAKINIDNEINVTGI